MTRQSSFLLVVVSMLLVSTAAAAQSRVVVMGAPGARDAVATALRVELASRGTVVLATDPPLGETRVARAASAQGCARANGADAAVWTDVVDEGGGSVTIVRVAPAADSEVRDAPLATGADARAVAVVAASLLGELLGPPDAPVAPQHVDVDVHTTVDVHVGTGAAQTTTTQTTASLPPAPPATPQAAPTPAAPVPTPAPRGGKAARSDVDYGLSAGALTLVGGRPDPGLAVRGTLGWTLGGSVRLGADAELAMIDEWYNGGSALQPTLRLGPSIELVVPIGDGSIRFGAHVRGVASSTWQYDYSGASSTENSTFAWGVSAGGSFAMCLSIDDHTMLDLRLELDGMARDVRGRTPWFVPALLVGLSWS